MKTFVLYDIFKSDTLRNRTTADALIREISSQKTSEKILLDFRNIVFVSRSFSNELLTHLDRSRFEFVNMNNSVKRMFDVAITKPKFSFAKPIKEEVMC